MTFRQYRILRFKSDASPITIAYTSKENRDEAAQKWADADHWVVGTEVWDKPDEFSDWGWWLDGTVAPSNCTHEHEKTGVATFPAGPARAIHTCEDCGATISELME